MSPEEILVSPRKSWICIKNLGIAHQGVQRQTWTLRTTVPKGLQKMNTGKSVGPDQIPTKLFKHNLECQKLLCQLIHKIWLEEEVPAAFARATFVILYNDCCGKPRVVKSSCLCGKILRNDKLEDA